MKESVGSQDQIAVSYGGFNIIKMKNECSYLNNIAESIQCLSDIDLFEKVDNAWKPKFIVGVDFFI